MSDNPFEALGWWMVGVIVVLLLVGFMISLGR